MDFVSNKKPQITEMLAAIGIKDISELFCDIPTDLILPRPSLDDGLSEYEGIRLMEALSTKNSYPRFENYLGAGAYEHHVPALIAAICGKSEFLTSYTPYQPEASQGMLQAIFEYQSVICALTGMDASNASVYDGASACAEAILMALRLKPEKKKILISEAVHPHYREVIQLYLRYQNVQIETIPSNTDGRIDFKALERLCDEQTAALLLQNPNFFGCIENVEEAFHLAKQKGAITILSANPMVYGLFKSAAELGADIAVGDGQPFGIPLQFGGPYVGYMACRQELIRQLPGRIVGETVDTKGRRGYVLTLQAREQHIRREKATSNICTNQALAALACLIGILWYGKKGVRELALTNYQRAHYLKDKLSRIVPVTHSETFNEFVVHLNKPIEPIVNKFRAAGIEPGIILERYYPQMKNALLVAVTETKSQEQLDRYAELLGQCI